MAGKEKLVVGLRFSKVGRVYHFRAKHGHDLKIGDFAVVETSRGWQLGDVVQLLSASELSGEKAPRKTIDRRATPQDLMRRQSWQEKEANVVKTVKAKAAEMKFNNIKIVAAEYSFDGAALTILFNTEGEEKVDLRSIKKVLQRIYSPTKVDMRQIGPRDVAKYLEGMGACGLEKRCCSQFLTEFNSISIRMAKEQGISLTPTEITGMCGRLRCCLNYEYKQYAEARKGLPKRNKRVITPDGEGKVIDILAMKGSVVVYIPEVGRREFNRDEIEIKPPEPQQRKKKK
jgi:cell fate regulator YaaT (PSP1 superfamily)